MILYLIRHGKTDIYLENKRQSPSTPLGELGRKQAKAMAEKMNLTKIDHLYSSDWPRAMQTAEYLSKSLSLEIKIHPHVHEIEKHHLLNDVADDSEINKRYLKEGMENKENFDWKFDGQGESLNDIINRGQKVIAFLEEQHPSDTVAIVSHGIFIMVLTSLILLGRDWDKKTFRKLSWALKVSNGGISSFKFDPQTKCWTMACFNDHSHLENES
ncbi:MAG: Fructose-2,6-bisphosphatase [Parcubacteria group bacterium GW2011_GWB1_36_5]|nr:MAG: Fructose-2,6-bisphosphatase [Parcubacteria group bacterium GW2011_GWB1_36_5]